MRPRRRFAGDVAQCGTDTLPLALYWNNAFTDRSRATPAQLRAEELVDDAAAFAAGPDVARGCRAAYARNRPGLLGARHHLQRHRPGVLPDRAGLHRPQRRAGRPVRRFLCSQASAYITGQVLMVDGWYTARS